MIQDNSRTYCKTFLLLTSAELHTLAKRLREMGKVQTAFLCGKRAVELKPDDWSAWYDLGEIAQCVGRRDEARVSVAARD